MHLDAFFFYSSMHTFIPKGDPKFTSTRYQKHGIGISDFILPNLAISSFIMHLYQYFKTEGYPFLCKGQVINISGFVSHMVPVTTTQLCHCCKRAAHGDA